MEKGPFPFPRRERERDGTGDSDRSGQRVDQGDRELKCTLHSLCVLWGVDKISLGRKVKVEWELE